MLCPIISEAIQGRVLDPQLFLLHFNNIRHIIGHSILLLFADDLKIRYTLALCALNIILGNAKLIYYCLGDETLGPQKQHSCAQMLRSYRNA